MSKQATDKKSRGCWTCKLRRKKCDEVRPRCGNCGTLEISCYSGQRPSWMDGGKLQDAKVASIKNEIKRNAALRRESANGSNIIVSNFGIPQGHVDVAMLEEEPTTISQAVDAHIVPHTHVSTHMSFAGAQQHGHACHCDTSVAVETDFIMKYIDFVLPNLFPFYRPTLFEPSRSWLLVLLDKSRVAYHCVVSLSTYFFTLALTDASEHQQDKSTHALCKDYSWEGVNDQTRKCFDSIQTELSALDLITTSITSDISGCMRTIQSLVQVLIFEVALGKAAPWTSHLPPAIALFERIMEAAPLSQDQSGQSKFTSVLSRLGKPMWSRPGQGSFVCGTIWTPEQAGFRFAVGLLIYYDIMASVVTKEPPKLARYHADVLSRSDGTSMVNEAEIRLSSIIGCRNDVLQSIADISSLRSFSNSDKVAGPDLEIRQDKIRQGLTTCIRNLNVEIDVAGSPAGFQSAILSSAVPSRTWAHAAMLYLKSESQDSITASDVEEHVMPIVESLSKTQPQGLRAVAWPICVAGCYLPAEEELVFRTLLTNRERFHTASAMDDATQIVEQVWKLRRSSADIKYSLSSCFSVLGSPILIA